MGEPDEVLGLGVIQLDLLIRQHPAEEAIVPFRAVNGQAVVVLAVLERTAVLAPDLTHSERRLVRLDALTVDPQVVQWHPLKGTAKRQHWASSQAGLMASRRATLSKSGRGICPRCPEGKNIHPLGYLNANRYCKACAKAYHQERDKRLRAPLV